MFIVNSVSILLLLLKKLISSQLRFASVLQSKTLQKALRLYYDFLPLFGTLCSFPLLPFDAPSAVFSHAH